MFTVLILELGFWTASRLRVSIFCFVRLVSFWGLVWKCVLHIQYHSILFLFCCWLFSALHNYDVAEGRASLPGGLPSRKHAYLGERKNNCPQGNYEQGQHNKNKSSVHKCSLLRPRPHPPAFLFVHLDPWMTALLLSACEYFFSHGCTVVRILRRSLSADHKDSVGIPKQ